MASWIDLQNLHNITVAGRRQGGRGQVKGDVARYEVSQALRFLVLWPEPTPLADTVCLVPNETDDLRSKLLILPKLLKTSILLHELLGANDDGTILAIFNCLINYKNERLVRK